MKKLVILLSVVAMLVSCSKETEDIINVSEKELQNIDGIGPKLAEKIKLFVND